MNTFTGIRCSVHVASSWMFIWIEPSPVMTSDGTSGRATAAPIPAGRPKPIVPSPPELIQRRGLSKWKYWAVHIWCWPTSEETIASPPVASYSASIRYCGLISLSGESS